MNESYKKIYDWHGIHDDETVDRCMNRDGFKTEGEFALWLSHVMGMQIAVKNALPAIDDLREKLIEVKETH